MKQKKDHFKTLSRRTFIIGALQTVAFGVLSARLFWLQIIEGDKYKVLSEKNRIDTKLIVPERGEIFDHTGVPLAVNKQNFKLVVLPEKTEDISQTVKRLQRIVDIREDEFERALDNARRMPSYIPLVIKEDLTWTELAKVEVHLPDFPGIYVIEGEKRSYPFYEATAHLIGFVGAPSEKDIGDDPLMRTPGFKLGKTGIEKSKDLILRGKSGMNYNEVNVSGRAIRTIRSDTQKNGTPVSLTINAELQKAVQTLLAQHKSASAVVMDVNSGALHALASHPSFDPNLFVGGISQAAWNELQNNPAYPQNNKATAGQYPPGSTFKMITLLAALESGAASPRTHIYCSGKHKYGRDTFRCWKLSGHGPMNGISAIEQSCDVYFYTLAKEVGIDRIAAMAKRFGLGQKYPFDLSEQKDGLIPTKAWAQENLKRSWRVGETIVSAIGQGQVLTTPLQLAVMTSRLVNGGYAVNPYLIEKIGGANMARVQAKKILIDPQYLALAKRGMDAVVNNKKGTAYGARTKDADWNFGGKTGTAQVKKINRAEYARGITNEDLQWRFRHHALFVGYAPLENPKYVCSVVVEHGGGGSAVAAPLAADILKETMAVNPSAISV